MRASDADRERVAAILRRNYEAGRLDDSDLERRLSQVLASRTLGQLREQLSDLPGPPPSLGRRLRYGVRTIKHPVVAAVGGIFVLLIVIGAIAGNDEQRAPSSGSGSASVAVPSVSPAPSPPADHITTVRAGGLGVDDGMAVRVRRITRHGSVALDDDNPPRLYPGPGKEFAVVDVEYSNRTSQALEPFCGEGGAKLYSRRHFGYDPVDREYRMLGNDAMCGGGIQPDETGIAHLLFAVPKHTRLAWIDVWNGDDNRDILGHTRLRMHLDGVPGA